MVEVTFRTITAEVLELKHVKSFCKDTLS